MEEWPTDPKSYEWIGKIGQGAFASVYKCSCTTASTTTTTNAHSPPLLTKDDSTTPQSQAVDSSLSRSKDATLTTASSELTTEPTITTPTTDANTDEPQLSSSSSWLCAIKVLNLDHVDSHLAEIRLEVQAMRLSSHPNILTCHAAFCQATSLWLVTPLCAKGSSLHCLQGARRCRRRRRRNESLSPQDEDNNSMEEHIMYILHETLLGLQYIHDNGQIHRDIKAGNILLCEDGCVKIADFGVSGWLINEGSQQQKAKTFVGTPCWMAPEVMEQIHGYDYKADIWSLGITALELAKGYAPYAKFPPMKVLILTIQEAPPTLESYDQEEGDDDDDAIMGIEEVLDETFSSSFQSLVDACLQKDPSKRPKSQELLQSKHLVALQNEETRLRRRQALVDEVCSLVDDVGSELGSGVEGVHGTGLVDGAGGAGLTASAREERDAFIPRTLPGNAPVSIILSQEENSRPAGTTWVFADGSQVLASSSTNVHSVDDVMDQIEGFGLQTGGEDYNRDGSEEQAEDTNVAAAAAAAAKEVNEDTDVGKREQDATEGGMDDLDAFMDEFELNTQGEDFRRPSKPSSN